MQPVGKKGSVQFLPHRGEKSDSARFDGRPVASLKGHTFSQATESIPPTKRLSERRLCQLFDRAVELRKAIPKTNFSDPKSYPDSVARSNFRELRSIHSKLDAFRQSLSLDSKWQHSVMIHQERIENALAYNLGNFTKYSRFELVVELSELYLNEPVLKECQKTHCQKSLEFALARLAFSYRCPLGDDLLNSEQLSKMEKCRDIAEEQGLALESAAQFNLYHHLGVAYARLHRDKEAARCFQVAHGGASFDPHKALKYLGVPDQQADTGRKTSGRLHRESPAQSDGGEAVNQRLARAYLVCAREDNQQIHDYFLATLRLITVSVLSNDPIHSAIDLIHEVCRMIKDLPCSAEKSRLRKEAATMFDRIAIHIRRSYPDDEELDVLDRLLPDAPPEPWKNMVYRQFQIHWHYKDFDRAYQVVQPLKDESPLHYYCNMSMWNTAQGDYAEGLEYLKKARDAVNPKNLRDIYVFHKRAAFLYGKIARNRLRTTLIRNPEISQKDVIDEALCHACVAYHFAGGNANLEELEVLIAELKAYEPSRSSGT